MATVRLVSPELVKKTNDLLAKVRRIRGMDKALHDWIALMDREPSPQPTAAPRAQSQVEPDPGSQVVPDTAPAGEPDAVER